MYTTCNLRTRLFKKKSPAGPFSLLLCFFVRRVLATTIAVFIEFDFTLNKLFILASPVVDALASLAGEFDQLVL